MIREFIGAGLDLTYLLWFWVPGIVLAYRIGFRYVTDLLPIGFLWSTAIATAVYSATYPLGLSAVSVPVTRGVLLVAAGLATVSLLKQVRPLAFAGLWAAIVATGAVLMRNIFRLDGWMQQADHWLTGWVAILMRTELENDIFATDQVIKKGIAFPVVYGMGREGLYLASVPTVILLLIVLATFRLVVTALSDYPRRVQYLAFLLMLALWMSTSMFLGFATYQHGHGFVALGVAVAARLVIGSSVNGIVTRERKSQTDVLPTWTLAGGLFLATFVMAQSRIESFALGLLILLPFLWGAKEKKTWQSLSPRLFAALGGPLGFVVWFSSIGASPVSFAPRTVVFALSIVGAVIAAMVLFLAPSLQHVARFAIPTIFVGALVPYLLPLAGSRDNFYFVRLNTFYGEGLWGYTWWVILAAGIFLVLDRQKTPRENLVLWLGVVVVLFTVLVKAIDNFGSPSQGSIRDGWSDSVNRTLFHSFSLMTAWGTIVISKILHGASQRAQRANHTGPVAREKLPR